jgi:hypothetical protein
MQRDGDDWPAVTVAAGSRACNANVAVTHFTMASFSNASAAVTLAGEPGGKSRQMIHVQRCCKVRIRNSFLLTKKRRLT